MEMKKVAHIEMKLGMHAYYIISMATTCFCDDYKQPQALLLKLANGSTHGDETWYAGMLHHFHDNHILFEQHQIGNSGTLNSSNLLTVALMKMKPCTNVYDIVSMTTTYYLNNNKQAQAFTSSLLKLTNSSTLGTHAYYIISMTTTGIYLYYKFFIGGSSPFTEIYVVVYKNEWRQVI